jgi:hypothetical protein
LIDNTLIFYLAYADIEWNSSQNNTPNIGADDNWGAVDENANSHGWD